MRNFYSTLDNGICSECGEVFFEGTTAESVHRRAVDNYKKQQGLLTGDEIRNLRISLGLSQARFEKLIGAGPKTVVRWENGSVFQNKTADKLLRVLRDYPLVAQDLMKKAFPDHRERK